MKKKIIIILVILICLLTFVLRLPVLYAPFDAAYEYLLAFLGRQIFKGGGFYSTPWTMNLPGGSLTYGLIYLLVGSENWELAVRLFSAILNSLVPLFLFLLGRTLFDSLVGIFTALFWAVFSSGVTFHGAAAYTEMLMPLFTILGIYLFFLGRKKQKKKVWFLSSGLVLGISLLYKQTALYDFLPLFVWSLGESFFSLRGRIPSKKSKSTFLPHFFLLLGFLVPLFIFIVYILFKGKFLLFWDWTIVKVLAYGKLKGNPISYLYLIWKSSFLVWGLAFLGVLSVLLKREKERIFLILWVLGGIASLLSSGKYWDYYFLQVFLPASLLASVFINDLILIGNKKLPQLIYYLKNVFLLALIIGILFNLNFSYFQRNFNRFLPYLQGKLTREEYRLQLSEGKKERERWYAAQFLKKNLKSEDKVFIWDDDHSLYVLADIMPLYNDYVWSQQFWYPKDQGIGFFFMHSYQNIEESKKDLIKKLVALPPNYVILSVDPSADIFPLISKFPQFFSFVFNNYELVKSIEDIWIYRLKENTVALPEKLVIDPNFASNYMSMEKTKTGVILEPLVGGPQRLEAVITPGSRLVIEKVPASVPFFGFDNQDFVGVVVESPSGVTDLHLKIKGVRKPIKMISVKKAKDLWVYPTNGLNYVIKVIQKEDKLDLYFEPPAEEPKGDYQVFIIYQDNSISKLENFASSTK